MEVTEDLSSMEVAAAENLAPEGADGSDPALVGGASCNPPPEGVTGEFSFSHLHGRPCWVISTTIRWGDGDACFYGFESTSRLGG
jgi:hypothetical protein